MGSTAVQLCSRACLKVGAASITSFEDGTAEAELASALYPSVRDGLLSSYRWRFTFGQAQLSKLVSTPKADYAFQYSLPSDFLLAISLGASAAGLGARGRGAEYRIVDGRLDSDADPALLSYQRRIPEGSFPAYFIYALEWALAAEFVLPLTESTSRTKYIQEQLDYFLRMAKSQDAQQATPSRIEGFPLTDVRG